MGNVEKRGEGARAISTLLKFLGSQAFITHFEIYLNDLYRSGREDGIRYDVPGWRTLQSFRYHLPLRPTLYTRMSENWIVKTVSTFFSLCTTCTRFSIRVFSFDNSAFALKLL